MAACQNWSTAPGTGTAIMVMAYPVIVIGQYRRVRSRLGMGSAVCARHVDGRVVLHSGGRQEGARAESYACRGLGSVSGSATTAWSPCSSAPSLALGVHGTGERDDDKGATVSL